MTVSSISLHRFCSSVNKIAMEVSSLLSNRKQFLEHKYYFESDGFFEDTLIMMSLCFLCLAIDRLID